MMESISTVIICRDDEGTIGACLESVSSFSSEIIVVDSGSTDNTLPIAANFTENIYSNPFKGFADQKNFAVSKASNDWIFAIDADESVTDPLYRKIVELQERGFRRDAYTVNRLTYYLTDWFPWGGWYPDRRIRLFNRKKASWKGQVYDYVALAPGARAGRIDADLLYYTFRSLAHQIEKMQTYTSLDAELRHRKLRHAGLFLVMAPLYRFVKTYLFLRAYKAGLRGFIFAVMAAIAVFVKYAKAWELAHKQDSVSGRKERSS